MLIEDLQVVLKVAELNSITHAAVKLDISTPTASNAIKRVEKTLGVELFVRTTRSIRLSNAGERYIRKCEEALHLLEQANKQLKNDEDVIDGDLRISVSSDLGRNLVAPWLNEFLSVHPDLGVRFCLSDSVKDFYQEPIDAALRYIPEGSLDESYFYGNKVCDVPHLLCASPEYLEKHGTPQSPDDLSEHNGLFYQLYDVPHDVWIFEKDNKKYKVKISSKHLANDGDLVRRWCVAGQGLAIKSCLDVSDELLSGKLVNVMPDFKPVSTELWLVSPSRQSITPAVKYFGEMVKTKCGNIITELHEKGMV
ncbi:LysR substrate-binding domain-containing protein [Vibrio sp. JC009]|uniref:LysR family transcriptional regulator n=1 Tax=Vibrio sp. JC009 TaxID=2912314 RepID=UPI0023AF5AFF|nr:LysR family transcriptional regulator [Vibrio sp. JC009]WED23723.1 LysR substrate-binding domain-containing protein [Vibrio sp. JC009]